VTVSVATTASAATITAGSAGAGTALAFWLVFKADSVVSIVDACS